MARNPKPTKKAGQSRRPKPTAAGGRSRGGRPKVCVFCRAHATWVDYKDVDLLRRFVNDRGRIKARGVTGTCAQHQRDVANAIKTARELAMLPYAVRTAAIDSRGGRGGGRRGNGPRPTAEGDTGGGAPADSAESDISPGEVDGAVPGEATAGPVATPA
ncbi:MAG: 30S ribosomal protein S18 [Acidimicrobiales bacterium]|nr:30S ribosomal protein S18 [Acidimicrobiales bacterium]